MIEFADAAFGLDLLLALVQSHSGVRWQSDVVGVDY